MQSRSSQHINIAIKSINANYSGNIIINNVVKEELKDLINNKKLIAAFNKEQKNPININNVIKDISAAASTKDKHNASQVKDFNFNNSKYKSTIANIDVQ